MNPTVTHGPWLDSVIHIHSAKSWMEKKKKKYDKFLCDLAVLACSNLHVTVVILYSFLIDSLLK